MASKTPDEQIYIDAVKVALKAIGRADMIAALDTPPTPPTPPTPQDPWVKIAAGSFLYGPDKMSETIETDYYIGRTPVTEDDWAVYCAATQQPIPSGYTNSKLPVVNISFYDAQAYCAWLTAYWHQNPEKRPAHWVPGMVVRLPREVEWERAARGTDGRIFPWGNAWDATKCAVRGKREVVGSYPQGASPDGVLDMSGNVWEWCDDAY